MNPRHLMSWALVVIKKQAGGRGTVCSPQPVPQQGLHMCFGCQQSYADEAQHSVMEGFLTSTNIKQNKTGRY